MTNNPPSTRTNNQTAIDFTDVMGPKLFTVPVFLGLAYLGMAYLSWTLAGVILDGTRSPLTGPRLVTLPLVAAFISHLQAWTIVDQTGSMEKSHATMRGGAYFGVPASNFLGWYLTVYLIYQLFALYLRGRSLDPVVLPSTYWHLAVLFYGVSAGGNLLLLIPQAASPVVTDPSGAKWRVGDITAVCTLGPSFSWARSRSWLGHGL